MPIYEYKCRECGYTFEVIQGFYDDSYITCSKCNKDTLRKVFSRVYVHYKGPGFHTTEARGITGRKRKPNIRVGNVRDLPPEEREKHSG